MKALRLCSFEYANFLGVCWVLMLWMCVSRGVWYLGLEISFESIIIGVIRCVFIRVLSCVCRDKILEDGTLVYYYCFDAKSERSFYNLK
jgi:hypothetical protein